MKTVYLDNAATSWPKPPEMMEAMTAYCMNVGASPGRSGHSLSVEAGRAVHEAREAVAELLGAPGPLTIAFTKNATEALNIALCGALRPGDHVIVSSMEHNSVMRPLRHLERSGVELSVAPCAGDGSLDPGEVRALVKKNTAMIVVTHASNVTGTMLPVEEIAGVAHGAGAIFCLDAAQTAGSVPIDVVAMDADILCFTGHKSLMGPQGTGGLYLRKGLEARVRPLMRGGTGSRSEFEDQPDFMPDRYESGTQNAIGLSGLAAGVRRVLKTGVARIMEHERSLTGLFIDGMREIPGVVLYGSDDPAGRTAVVSFNIRNRSPSDIAFALDERWGIMSRPGLQCAPAAHRTIGTFPHGTVRCSLSMYTTVDEVHEVIRAIDILVKEK